MPKYTAWFLCFATVAACSNDDDAATPPTTATDAGGGSDAASTSDGSAADGNVAADAATDAPGPYVEPTCNLINDSGGPGQYSDGCVKREWVAPYAGTYKSANCELTISITGSVAATFSLKVSGATLAGTYANDWDGAPSPGNDSYYRFTTDATFATTKTLNFAAGKGLGGADESAVSFRVEGLDTGTVVLKGRYSELKGGQDTEVDCGTYTKQ